MGLDVTRLDLSIRRRGILWYSAGMALYVFVVVAIYPAFKDSTGLNNLTNGNPTAAALFGVTGSLTSPGGWLNGNIYANFFPLIMLLITVGYGAAALAGQDEDGTLSLVATLPLRRSVIVLQKVAAMSVQGFALAATVAVFAVLGRSFDLTAHPADVVAVSVAVLLMGLDLGLVAMAVGGLTGRRGTSIAVGATLAAASYLLSSLAPVVSWLRPLRYGSLFYWSVGNEQIVDGVRPLDYAILIAVGSCAAVAAVAAFRRLDLH